LLPLLLPRRRRRLRPLLLLLEPRLLLLEPRLLLLLLGEVLLLLHLHWGYLPWSLLLLLLLLSVLLCPCWP
jgi:hypothetical protein